MGSPKLPAIVLLHTYMLSFNVEGVALRASLVVLHRAQSCVYGWQIAGYDFHHGLSQADTVLARVACFVERVVGCRTVR